MTAVSFSDNTIGVTSFPVYSYLFRRGTDTSRKPIEIGFADRGLLWLVLLYRTIYAVPHKSDLNSYVYSI
jgi:hypothetical protein